MFTTLHIVCNIPMISSVLKTEHSYFFSVINHIYDNHNRITGIVFSLQMVTFLAIISVEYDLSEPPPEILPVNSVPDGQGIIPMESMALCVVC
jgi:hypothetical protein